MNFRRGLLRLAMILMMLWLVFWTIAYVIRSPVSENTSPPTLPVFSLTVTLVALAILAAPWVASGFRQDR
jgi:hypothetical protein